MRGNQSNLLVSNLRWPRILQRLQPIRTKAFASLANLLQPLSGDPARLKFRFAPLHHLRNHRHHARQLPSSRPRDLFERFSLRQQLQRLFRRRYRYLLARRLALPFFEPLQLLQNLRAILLHLLFAKPQHIHQLLRRFRPHSAQCIQRIVIHHDVRRHSKFLRLLAPPRPQVLSQFRIDARRGLIIRKFPKSSRVIARPSRAKRTRRAHSRRRCQPSPLFRTSSDRRRYRLRQPRRRHAAHIARVTPLPLWLLAKVRTNPHVPALHILDKSPHRVVARPRALFLFQIIQLVDEIRQQPSILLLPQHHAVRRQPIASRASRFLVILFYRLRQRQ